ncbi:type II toxin-antitoxin system PemK/MazF family toxin [Thiomicrospira cyclica]|uniref:PemK family protein n=1 Tax=Thiomicrospira cyclica (strain DSM 14477 / JCM 11371 / ALM1) TaxID=717773 RepID=F6DAT7_THICA|nr:type II toxin-antitoxin system PemK/MazF family toxin [Thiomicrospira cyclica]AEG31180.1 PemK family protein [Thiomicrospira cyclica ALM1]
MIRRGEVYLVNFGKQYNSEFGKVRPALIIQNDLANRVLERVHFKGVTVIPLTTNLVGGDLRVKIDARDNLKQTSEICINELCTLDLLRIQPSPLLTKLNSDELNEVALKLRQHLSI